MEGGGGREGEGERSDETCTILRYTSESTSWFLRLKSLVILDRGCAVAMARRCPPLSSSPAFAAASSCSLSLSLPPPLSTSSALLFLVLFRSFAVSSFFPFFSEAAAPPPSASRQAAEAGEGPLPASPSRRAYGMFFVFWSGTSTNRRRGSVARPQASAMLCAE